MAKKNECCSAEGCGCQKMKLQPIGDRVVVKREESTDKTAGGIYLPDSAKDKPARGTIISIGCGRILDNGQRSKFQVKEKDKVLFLSYAGEEFKLDGEEFLLMRESDILAVIE